MLAYVALGLIIRLAGILNILSVTQAFSGTAELSMILLCLLRAGIKHVAIFHRGYEGCHELYIAGRRLYKFILLMFKVNWNSLAMTNQDVQFVLKKLKNSTLMKMMLLQLWQILQKP